MNRHDRKTLALLALLLGLPALLALIIAVSGTSVKTSSSGPVILSPREGDEVGPDFSVDGTHGTSGLNVDVTVSGPYTGSGTCTSSPDWSVPFHAGAATGDHTANATSYVSLGGVNFKIVGSQALDLGAPSVSMTLGGLPKVMVAGRHAHPTAPPAVAVTLFRPDKSVVATTTATDIGGGNWTAEFAAVPSGSYAVQARMTVGGKTTTCSRFVKVP